MRVHDPHQLYQRTYPGEYQNRPFNPKLSWPYADKDLGWVFNMVNVMHSTRDRQVFYKMNHEGFRDDKDFDANPPDPGKKRIMVLGDSFVFGLFINREDTIPSLLQKRMGGQYSVYNFGIMGWGVDQMYFAYEKYRDKIKPDVCVLFFIDDDIVRTFEAYRKEDGNKPSFNIKDGRLVLRRGKDTSVWEEWLKGSYLWELVYTVYRYVYAKEIVRLVFHEMIQESRQHHEEFMVVRIPSRDDLKCHNLGCMQRSNYFSFKDYFNKAGINYVEIREYMKNLTPDQYDLLYIPKDSHLSRKGTEFVTNTVAPLLAKFDHKQLLIKK